MITPAAALGPEELIGHHGSVIVRVGDRFKNSHGEWEVVGFSLDLHASAHLGMPFKGRHVNCKWLGRGRPMSVLKPSGPDKNIVQFFGWSVADNILRPANPDGK